MHMDHGDHAMPMEDAETQPAASDPHAGHEMPAMETAPDPHAGHDMPAMDHSQHQAPNDTATIPQSGPPPAALSGPAHAADALFGVDQMAPSREQLRGNQGGQSHSFFGLDRLEAQIRDGEDSYLWDSNFWTGGDIDKLWVKSEGEIGSSGEVDEAEVQALWSHAIGPFFDLQTGVRYDIRPRPDRPQAVIGVQGLAPYFFELDAAAFISTKGDITARIEAEYDQRITQRLILQPRAELLLSAQDIPEYGVGSGFSSLQAGLRLRYEITRQLAPYIGIEWQRDIGDTADYTRTAGGEPDQVVGLVGLRFWF